MHHKERLNSLFPFPNWFQLSIRNVLQFLNFNLPHCKWILVKVNINMNIVYITSRHTVTPMIQIKISHNCKGNLNMDVRKKKNHSLRLQKISEKSLCQKIFEWKSLNYFPWKILNTIPFIKASQISLTDRTNLKINPFPKSFSCWSADRWCLIKNDNAW